MTKKSDIPSKGKQRMDAVLLAFNVRTYIQTLVSKEQAQLMLDALGIDPSTDNPGIDEYTITQQLGPDDGARFQALLRGNDRHTIRAIAHIALGETP